MYLRHDVGVTMTEDDFVSAVRREVPEAGQVVSEHVADNGDVLIHLLTADLRRFAVHAFESGQADVLVRLLHVVERGLLDGSDLVQNAVAVSFVEDTGWWDSRTAAFIASWPAGLQAEAERQRD
jgi:hypothetical protein